MFRSNQRDHSPDQTVSPSPAVSRPNDGTQGQEQLSPPPPPQQPRRSSFSFLRRQKSTEMRSTSRSGSRSTSITKISKRNKADDPSRKQQQQQQQGAAAIPPQPPRLPSYPPLPQLNSFGGENARPGSLDHGNGNSSSSSNAARSPGSAYDIRPSIDSRMGSNAVNPSFPPYYPVSGSTASLPHNVPIPPIPVSPSAWADPYARTESMTNRGRYSYASSAISTINSPRRMRRRKDPTPFNILVIGAKNCGKTSFVNFLRTSLALPAKKRQHSPSPVRQLQVPNSPFTAQYLETEIEGERIGLTIWDSQGLEKNIADLQLREMAAFVESKFEETFNEEQKVVRAPGVQDTHIHCVFLVLDPIRLDSNIALSQNSSARDASGVRSGTGQRTVGGLDDELDLQVLRALQGKTTVVPVISKADTVTSAHMVHLKKIAWSSLKEAKLDPLLALSLDESDDELDPGKFETEDDNSTGGSSSNSSVANRRRNRSNSSSTIDPNDKNPAGSGASTNDNEKSSDDPPSPKTSPSTPRKPKTGTAGRGHQRSASSMSTTIANNTNNTSTSDDVNGEPPFLPFSILSPDPYSSSEDRPGRVFPWGFADPFSPDHCDFVRLKESVFTEWRSELREAARERWYEGWRTSRLKRRAGSVNPAGANGWNAGQSQGQVRGAGAGQQRMASGLSKKSNVSGLSPVGEKKVGLGVGGPKSRSGNAAAAASPGSAGVGVGGSPGRVRNGQPVGIRG